MYSLLASLGSLLLSLVLAGAAGAQTSPQVGGVISGRVQSAEGAPLASTSVALRRVADSTVVGGSITAENGTFRLERVAPGSYLVEVSHLGYQSATRSGVTIAAPGDHVDLGIIRLETGAIDLEGVEVTVERPAVLFLPDRNVYSTRDMPAAAGGTATDVLRSVPELEVNLEGRVTTRGATPRIHINGRPAPMQGEALDRYLQQLPAERIERIEVIANPSARYEAEGQGGIVNIVMKRGTNLGLSGSLAVNAGTRNQKGGTGNINYQEGRLTLFGSASTNFFGNDSENSDLRENLNVQPTTYIQQDSWDHNSGGFGSLDLGAEMKAGSRGTFWTDTGIRRNALDMRTLTAYTHLDHLRNLTQRYDRVDDRDRRGLSGNAAVGYRHVARARSEWSLELRRNFNDDDNASESVKYALHPDGAPLDSAPELTLAGEGQEQSGLSLEANVMRGWGESGQVEVGYRGWWRNAGSNFRMRVDVPEDFRSEEELAGDFRNREMIHAGYVTTNRQVGRFRVQLGMRGEQAEMRRALALTGETFGTSYSDFFPSANISTGFGTGGQLRFSYSRRVDRPGGDILNPVTPSLDPLNLRVGNPYLMPRYTHSLSFTASRTGLLGSLQLSPFYRRTLDSWDQIRTVDSAGVSTVTWQNLATITSYGASISASVLQLGPVGGIVSVRGQRTMREAGDLGADFSGSSTRFSLLSNVNVRATSALNVQGTLTYLPAIDLPQGRISSMVFTSLGLRQQIRGGRGAINVAVVDPFELQRFTFTTRDGTHVQVGSSTLSARRATLGISYNFGRPPQSSRRRTAEEGEQEVRQIR
jgi:hypothetical protein